MSRARSIATVIGLLRSLGHSSALVGGLAVSVRARERFTRDIDLAVAVTSDAESEALAFAMQRSGYILRMVVEQEERKVLATLRFSSRGSTAREPEVDLLFASCGIEREIVAASSPVEIEPGVVIPVATIQHLIAMKVLSVREERDQDAGDLRALLAVASEMEIREAEEALHLIVARGFDRGKRLIEELWKFERPGSPPA